MLAAAQRYPDWMDRLEADGIGWIGLIAERKTHPFYQPLGFAPMADALPMLKKR